MGLINIADNNEMVNGDTIFHGIANDLSPIIAAFISSIIVGLGALIAWKTYKNTRESTPPELLKLDKWTDSAKKIIEVEEKNGSRLLNSATMNELKESINIYTQRALWESSLIKSGAPKSVHRRLSDKYPSENLGKSTSEVIPGNIVYNINSFIAFLFWILGSCIIFFILLGFIWVLFLRITGQSTAIIYNDKINNYIHNILGSPEEAIFSIKIIILLVLIKIIPHVYIYVFMKNYILSHIYYAYSRYFSPIYTDKNAIISTQLDRFTLWGRLSVRFIDRIRGNTDSVPVISSKSNKKFIFLYFSYLINFLIVALGSFIYYVSNGENNLRMFYATLIIIILFIGFMSFLFEFFLFLWPDINFLTWEELHIFGLGKIFPAEDLVYNVNGTDLEICTSNIQDVNDVVYLSYPLKYTTVKKISRKGEVEFRGGKYFCKFKFNPQDMKVTVGGGLYPFH